jgi:hypothetical protein
MVEKLPRTSIPESRRAPIPISTRIVITDAIRVFGPTSNVHTRKTEKEYEMHAISMLLTVSTTRGRLGVARGRVG